MNMPRKTLGRGLDDLMSEVARIETPLATASDRGFLQLPLESLAEPAAPPAALPGDLLESIRTHGVLQPILACKTDSGYETIDGRRRLQAARALGLRTIPAFIINKPQADAAVLASEANRRGVLPPEPIAAPCQQPAIDPAPNGWRSDWRLPAAFAAIALLALLLGAGAAGMICSSGWAPVSLPASDRAGDSTVHLESCTATNDNPAVPSEAAGLTAQLQQATPPAWSAALNIEGVQATTDGDATTLTFQDAVFSRHTTFDPQAERLLGEVAEALGRAERPLVIQVLGHTDDTPMRGGGPYRDNYDLGLARATRVVQFLRHQANLTNATFSAASQGEDHPPYPNDSPANRRSNRTVTLEISAE
jgi:outer membrane protein OmpA-like peptidoglycan-associated protein